MRADGITGPELPHTSPHTVTVPGACAGWADTVTKFGSGAKTLADLLQPAIRMAEQGEIAGSQVVRTQNLESTLKRL